MSPTKSCFQMARPLLGMLSWPMKVIDHARSWRSVAGRKVNAAQSLAQAQDFIGASIEKGMQNG